MRDGDHVRGLRFLDRGRRDVYGLDGLALEPRVFGDGILLGGHG
jgi:hypothetical protein